MIYFKILIILNINQLFQLIETEKVDCVSTINEKFNLIK